MATHVTREELARSLTDEEEISEKKNETRAIERSDDKKGGIGSLKWRSWLGLNKVQFITAALSALQLYALPAFIQANIPSKSQINDSKQSIIDTGLYKQTDYEDHLIPRRWRFRIPL
jgi:hypothetical protein